MSSALSNMPAGAFAIPSAHASSGQRPSAGTHLSMVDVEYSAVEDVDESRMSMLGSL